jgi:hypothetical protein
MMDIPSHQFLRMRTGSLGKQCEDQEIGKTVIKRDIDFMDTLFNAPKLISPALLFYHH